MVINPPSNADLYHILLHKLFNNIITTGSIVGKDFIIKGTTHLKPYIKYPVLLVTMFLLTSCSHHIGSKFYRLADNPSKNTAQVYFYRPHIFMGPMWNMSVSVDNKEIGKLPPETYLIRNIRAGQHVLQLNGGDPIAGLLFHKLFSHRIHLQGGRRYFYSITFHRDNCESHYIKLGHNGIAVPVHDYCVIFAPVSQSLAMFEMRRLHKALWPLNPPKKAVYKKRTHKRKAVKPAHSTRKITTHKVSSASNKKMITPKILTPDTKQPPSPETKAKAKIPTISNNIKNKPITKLKPSTKRVAKHKHAIKAKIVTTHKHITKKKTIIKHKRIAKNKPIAKHKRVAKSKRMTEHKHFAKVKRIAKPKHVVRPKPTSKKATKSRHYAASKFIPFNTREDAFVPAVSK